MSTTITNIDTKDKQIAPKLIVSVKARSDSEKHVFQLVDHALSWSLLSDKLMRVFNLQQSLFSDNKALFCLGVKGNHIHLQSQADLDSVVQAEQQLLSPTCKKRKITLKITVAAAAAQLKQGHDRTLTKEQRKQAHKQLHRERKAKRKLERQQATTSSTATTVSNTDTILEPSNKKKRHSKHHKHDRDNKDRTKKEAKQKKNDDDIDLSLVCDTWPANICKLYLDGNNMLFLTSLLRSLTLHKSKDYKLSSDKLLVQVAKRFQEHFKLQLTHVIFDRSKDTVEPFNVKTGFEVSCAHPTFTTSDDALVDMASKEIPENKSACLFVTSDRELRTRLKQQGVKVCGPKKWIKFVCQVLSGGECQDVDQWMEQEFLKKLQ